MDLAEVESQGGAVETETDRKKSMWSVPCLSLGNQAIPIVFPCSSSLVEVVQEKMLVRCMLDGALATSTRACPDTRVALD